MEYNYNNMLKKRGTEADPIDLEESLEEERDVTNEMKEEARNRAIIEQAKITGSKQEICLAVAKTMVPGTRENKNRGVGKVIIKHFSDSLNIKIQCDNFKRRREADYSLQTTEPNPCEFVLYGVDFLSTKMIVDRFKLAESELERVVWVDDSNCKLVFKDEDSAKKMLESQLKYSDTLKSKIEEDVDVLPRCWFLLKPYQVYTYQRNLYLRYATTLEQNMEKDIDNNYEEYVKVQEELYPKLLKQFNATDKYLSIMQEIQNEKGTYKRYTERSRSRNDRKSQFQGEEYNYQRRNNENGDRHNRSRNYGRPGSFHARQINKERYEHQLANSRYEENSVRQSISFRMNNSIREINPNPNLSFVYFDQEDPKNYGNLSFELKNSLNLSHRDYDKKMQDVQNLDFSMRQKSILAEEGLQNLSVIYAERQKGDIDLNLSINVNKLHNKSANDIDLNYSIFQSKDPEEKSKDLNELAQFFEVSELSPIEQQNPLNLSFQVEEKSIIKPKPIPADLQFNNYRKPDKKKLEIEVLSDYSY